jgi:6-phosphogluconolactonase
MPYNRRFLFPQHQTTGGMKGQEFPASKEPSTVFKRAILATSFLCGLAGLAGCGSSHHTAYVTTPLNSSVSAFRVDNHSGQFSELPGSPYPAGISPSVILVHPNHKFAYVSNGGENDVSLFKINSNFSLSEIMPRTPAGTNPSSMSMDPAGKFLYVCNSGYIGGVASNTVSIYAIDASSGALSEVGQPVNVGYNPVFLTVSPSGKFLYVANGAAGTLSAFTIGSSGGLTEIQGSPYSLTGGGSGSQGPGPNWIAINPQEKYLFVANLLANTIGAYSINGTTGALTGVAGQPFNTGTGPSSVTFDKTGSYLYVTNLNSSNVSAYFIGATGIPTQLGGSPYSAGSNPSIAQLDPSGNFLYVGTQAASAGGAKQVLSFYVNAQSGELTPIQGSNLDSTPTSLFVLP